MKKKVIRECCNCKKSYFILEVDNKAWQVYLCQSCLKANVPKYESEAKEVKKEEI